MSDESAYQQDAKPKANGVLNLALAICFTGLFFMLAGAVALVAFFAVGGKTIDTNFGYLIVVSLYLGMIVVALVGAAYSFGAPEEKHRPMVAPIFRKRPRQRD
jgi:hypothetical protein